ncbi:MAG: DUF1569 domain-containing protein [Bacteroidota bacterium]|nr:DUF1569 domain-containing protein [Bacteroidota bacterium]
MKSLLRPETKQEFAARINKITSATKPQWGIMNAEQMLRHCQVPLELAIDKVEIKSNKLITFLFGKRILKSIKGDAPFRRNIPTFKEAKLPATKGFEVERRTLLELVNEFELTKITTKPHPFFGVMTKEDWDVLQTKHLDHHLNQFGV